MKKNFTRIADKIYNEPWLLNPDTLDSLATQFENYTAGKLSMPDFDKMPEDEEEAYTALPNVLPMSVNGIMGRHLSLMETLCGGVDVESKMKELKVLAGKNPSKIGMIWNSGGGKETGMVEFGELVSEINQTIPIYMYTSGFMCSAAYWVGSQGTAIYASPTARVGNIGCFRILVDDTKAQDIEGRKRIIISAGEDKVIEPPFTQEQLDKVQEDCNKLYAQFKSVVSAKRPQINFDVIGARAYRGIDGINNGLVDGIFNTADEFLQFIATV